MLILVCQDLSDDTPCVNDRDYAETLGGRAVEQGDEADRARRKRWVAAAYPGVIRTDVKDEEGEAGRASSFQDANSCGAGMSRRLARCAVGAPVRLGISTGL